MSRPISAHQGVRASSTTAKAVQIVKAVAYSDYDARTISATFYWATSALRYDYGNTGTTQDIPAFLIGISPLTATIPHLQDRSALDTRELSLTISNEDDKGYAYYSQLINLSPFNMLGASVELSELLIDDFGIPFTDLSALVGDEHSVLFRGEVYRMGPCDDLSLAFQCRTIPPRVRWGRASDPLAAPRDFGARLPIVYGQAKKVPCIAGRVGSVSTVQFPITASSTAISVTDTSRFSTAGSALIATEKVTWTGKSSSQLTGVTRGVSGTKAAQHKAGETIAEALVQSMVVLAQHRVSAIRALYVRNPLTDLITLVDPSLYYFQNPAQFDGVPGFPCATVHFPENGLRTLASYLFASAQVTQQPNFASTATPTNVSNEIAVNQAPFFGSNVRDGNTATGTTLSFLTQFNNPAYGTVYWNAPAGPITALTIDVYVGAITNPGGVEIGSGGQFFAFSGTTGAYQTFTFTSAGSAFSAHSARIACAFGSSVDVREVRRSYTYTAPPVATLPTVNAEIEAAAVGYGLEFFADIDGAIAPCVWATAYDFDASAGWNSSAGCLYVNDVDVKRQGAAALKVRMVEGSDTTLINAADSTTNWSGANCTPSTDTGLKTQGTASIKGTAASAAVTSLTVAFSAIDLTTPTKKYLAFDLLFAYGTMNGDISILIKSTPSNYYVYNFDALTNFIPGKWYTILIHVDVTPPQTVGSFNKAAATEIGIQWNNGSTKENGAIAWVDNVRWFAESWNVQKNDLANLDFTASASTNHYRFFIRGSQLDTVPRDVVLYFADAAGSGTTIPAGRWELNFDNLDQIALEQDWFRVEYPVFTVVGSPGTISAISTLGIFVSLSTLAHGVHRVLTIDFSVWIDLLEARASDAGSNYEAIPGALIEHPVDVLRHWVEEVGGGTLDNTSADESVINLGAAAKLACDMRALTPDAWSEAAARLAFESRANLVPDERSTGTVWRILTAQADFDFAADALSGKINAYSGRSFVFKSLDQLWTRFQFFYAPDPTLGNGDEEFTKLIAIGPGANLVAPSELDIAASEHFHGVRYSDPIFFLCIQDNAFAQQVAAYYANELLRWGAPATTIAVQAVPWYDAHAYQLEVGDQRTVAFLGAGINNSPGGRWNTGSPTYRIIEVTRSFGAQQLQFELRGVGV